MSCKIWCVRHDDTLLILPRLAIAFLGIGVLFEKQDLDSHLACYSQVLLMGMGV